MDTRAQEAAPEVLARLLQRAGLGDANAFGEAYDDLIGDVWRLVRLREPNIDRAQYRTQDLMVELWRRAPGFNPTTHEPRTWALGICRQVATR